MEYDVPGLAARIEKRTRTAVRDGRIDASAADALLECYRRVLEGYTYFRR